MKRRRLADQVVVVFGASSGIGRQTAKQFALRGAHVVVAARGEEGLESLVAEIRAKGGEATAIAADAIDIAQVRRVAQIAADRYGRLDTWVHVAAVTEYALFEDTPPEEYEQIIRVNLVGQMNGARAALPHLRRSGQGALIHVSSIEALRPLPYNAAYAASKHGLHGFLDTLRMELDHENVPVTVTEVMPASINTPLFNKARTRLGVKPMGLPPVYPPEVVADVILRAAEHPRPQEVAGGAGKALLLSQRFAPRATDALMERIAFTGQKTDEPKSASAPNNLFAPIRGYDRVEGDFADQARLESAAPFLQRNKWALAAAGVAAVLATRALRAR